MWQVIPVAVLLVVGLFAGGWIERAHFRRLAVKEAELRDMIATNLKSLPHSCSSEPFDLVFGHVVISSDYFKSFVAQLRKLVGGELRTYESLMDRARREALVRLLESARQMGANHVMNVRFSAANIGSTRSKQKVAMVEMIAYGTAAYIPTAA